MSKVAIVACSNGQSIEYERQNAELVEFLESSGNTVVESDCIYAKEGIFQGTAKERAAELMRMYEDQSILEIYDISGGDIANQILEYLDYGIIANSRALFWGYSDLTTILNAIYTLTGKESVLYQVKNMVWGSHDINTIQRDRFINRNKLFDIEYTFIQGRSMKGVTVGGNIRCFLKLAGTRYFPDLRNKILVLEALGGGPAQMSTYLAQLQQLGAFEKVNGIILGDFREMEKEKYKPGIEELVKEYAGPLIPIAKTDLIGHKKDAKAIVIGRYTEIG